MSKLSVNSLCAISIALILASCGKEEWTCVEQGKNMYSVNTKGHMGSADKGCSCEEMREFEIRHWGSVDKDALKNDFGC